jgi:hypothetical protein
LAFDHALVAFIFTPRSNCDSPLPPHRPPPFPIQALTLASVAVDLRVAQVVDKPQASMEAILPLNIFTGEALAKINAAVGM